MIVLYHTVNNNCYLQTLNSDSYISVIKRSEVYFQNIFTKIFGFCLRTEDNQFLTVNYYLAVSKYHWKCSNRSGEW